MKNLQCCCHSTVPLCDTDPFLLLSTLIDSGLSAYSHLPVAASTEEPDKQQIQRFLWEGKQIKSTVSVVSVQVVEYSPRFSSGRVDPQSENSTNIKSNWIYFLFLFQGPQGPQGNPGPRVSINNVQKMSGYVTCTYSSGCASVSSKYKMTVKIISCPSSPLP